MNSTTLAFLLLIQNPYMYCFIERGNFWLDVGVKVQVYLEFLIFCRTLLFIKQTISTRRRQNLGFSFWRQHLEKCILFFLCELWTKKTALSWVSTYMDRARLDILLLQSNPFYSEYVEFLIILFSSCYPFLLV